MELKKRKRVVKKENILRTNCPACNGPVTVISDSVRVLRLRCTKCYEVSFIVENKFGIYSILSQEEYNKKEKNGLLFE